MSNGNRMTFHEIFLIHEKRVRFFHEMIEIGGHKPNRPLLSSGRWNSRLYTHYPYTRLNIPRQRIADP